CLAAYALAKNNAGLNPKILILEAGGFAPDRDSMYEIYARNPYKGQASPYSPDFAAPEPRQNLAGTNYYTYPADVDVKADPSRLFGSFYQRLVGGSGWHWQGLAPRMVPNDFVHASKFGNAIKARYGSKDFYLTDWPSGCRYDDLEPWFSAAEHEMGVAGDTQAFSANFFGSHRS